MIPIRSVAALLAFAPATFAQMPAQVVARQNDLVPSLPGQSIESFSVMASNATGGWACMVTTTDGVTLRQHIIGDIGAGGFDVLRSPSSNLAGYEQVFPSYVDGWLGLDDQGRLAYGCQVRPAGTGYSLKDSAWFENSLLAVVDNTAVTSVDGAYVTRDGRPYWFSNNRIHISVQGNFLFNPSTVPGLPNAYETLVPSRSEVSPSATHLLVGCNANAPSLYPVYLVLDGALATYGGQVIQSGQPIPVAAGGLPGDVLTQIHDVAVNDRGDWAFSARYTDALGVLNCCVVVNGQVRYRGGDVVDGFGLASNFTPPFLSLDQEGGLAMHAYVDAGYFQNVPAIFYEGRAIAVVGDAIDQDGDGNVEPIGGISHFWIHATRGPVFGADRSIYVSAMVDVNGTYFTADDSDMLLRIPIPPIEYGQAKVNSLGLRSRLFSSGRPSLIANNFTLELTDLVPGKSGQAFYGASRASTPFFGGTLLVGGQLTRMPTVAASNIGTASTAIAIQPSMVGSVVRYQFWQRDPAHPDGTGRSLTNGLEVSFFP